jgi:CRP/FNR family transcriptional regulator, cyclic AMP receptor protein
MKTASLIHDHQAEFQRLIAQMAAHPFLKDMSAKHLGTLALYAMRTEFEPGQRVFRQGDLANRFYLILAGTVDLEAVAPNRRPMVIQTIGPGEVLGWSWLFPPHTWRFAARAVEPVQAIFFYGTRLREHCAEDADFGHELMLRVAEVTVARLNALRQRLLEISDT